MFKDILITGVTDLSEYPKKKYTKYCKQFLDTDSFFVPCNKPDIESINELKVNICVNETEIINTILGPKLIIHGEKNVKILYTANNPEQSVHSAHWSVPFCDFILLDCMCINECVDRIDKNFFVGIEYACVTGFDCRNVHICMLYILCPIIKNSCTPHLEYPCPNAFSYADNLNY